MAEGTISASGGEIAENTQKMASGLPSWMPKDPDSGNFRLFNVIGQQVDELDEDIRDTTLATQLQNAQSIGEVEQLAEPVGTVRKTGETLEKFRTRVLSDYQLLTGEGTIPELIENAALLLDISVDNVLYERLEPGYGTLKVPLEATNNFALTDEEFAEIMSSLSAASYRMEITKSGTFQVVTPEDYNLGNYDPARGVGGLDINGDPKDKGGTVSGIL